MSFREDSDKIKLYRSLCTCHKPETGKHDLKTTKGKSLQADDQLLYLRANYNRGR